MAPPIRILSLSLEEIEQRIAEYFDSRIAMRKVYPRDRDPFEEEYVKPPTFTGLARSIDISRMTLWRYLHRREDLDADVLLVLSRACDELAEMIEEATFNRETYQGARFALEVNHRYGKEEEGGVAGGFAQTIVQPAITNESEEPLAIPKWSDDDE